MSGVMEMASELLTKIGKPAYVEFSTVAKEIIKRGEDGQVIPGPYQARDVDMVTVRQVGSADSSIFEVTRWLAQNTAEVQAGRLPREHAAHYDKMYSLWKAGQELPVEGTPIKGWAMIPPSQQEIIVRVGIRTVEDLATINAEAMQRIGMGAVMLKNKAQAWVSQAKDKGPATQEIAQLKQQNDVLTLNLEKLQAQVAELQRERPKHQAGQVIEAPEPGIGLLDILDTAPPEAKKKR